MPLEVDDANKSETVKIEMEHIDKESDNQTIVEDGVEPDGMTSEEADKPLLNDHDQCQDTPDIPANCDSDQSSNDREEMVLVDRLHNKLKSDAEESKIFLKDPSPWLKEYISHWTFPKDGNDYIKCVCSVLKQDEEDKVCPPISIAIALVTEDRLMKLNNPMECAIKLEYEIKEIEKLSGDLHKKDYEDLVKVLSTFAVSLLETCLSRAEVEQLMRSKEILQHIQSSRNTDIVAEPYYNSLYTENYFWREPGVGLNSPFSWKGLKRFLILTYWNLVYWLVEIITCCKKDDKGVKYKFHKTLFSPVSCYFADLVNYTLLVLLIFAVVLESHIGSNNRYTQAIEFRDEVKNKVITPENNPRVIYDSDGTVKFRLVKSPISLTQWLLFTCILSRILYELYQMAHQHVVPRIARFDKESSDEWRRVKQYWKSDMNKIDCVLMMSLICAFGIKLHYVYRGAVYIRVCMKENGCEGDGVDYSLEARRFVYMIHLYSVAALLTLVRMFYSIFLFVPLIGPILRSIQMMLRDVFTVVVILVFFSAGFFVPLYTIVQCYRTVHIDDINDNRPVSVKEGSFKTMKSPSTGAYTMILSMMGGQLTFADDVYGSKDLSTSVFLSGILVVYYIFFGLLCVNLLVSLITNRYAIMRETKNKDHTFAQFCFLMDYNATEPECCMPFYFPFCIVYIIWRLGKMIVELPCFKCNKGDKKSDMLKETIPTLIQGTSGETIDAVNGRDLAELLLNRKKAKETRRKDTAQGH